MNKNIEIGFGKIPPQAIDLEEAVLGGIMLEKDSLIEIIDIIRPESFYHDQHQKIYSSILDLFKKNEAIDILTVIEQLRKNGYLELVGGPAYLTKLTDRIASAAHIEFHARIIQQKYIQRELIRVSTEIQNRAFDESIDLSDTLDYAGNCIFNITNKNIINEPVLIGNIGIDTIRNLEELSINDNYVPGIQTGISNLDKHTNGWQNTNLIIIAARPSMGKTTLAFQMAINISLIFKEPVAYFSYEMSKVELYKKGNSSLTGIESEKYMNGKFTSDEWLKVEEAQAKLEKAPLFIDDTSNMTILELRAKARRLKIKHNIKIIFIDYLQLIYSNNKGNREQEVSDISRNLKILAKELDIPIIALSQLNRSCESRIDKKPQLSDIRESGAIEQDADIVSFLYRPSYYGFTEFEDGMSTKGILEILFRKYRNGKLGDIMLKHDHNFTKISDFDEFNDKYNKVEF
jgi:replicative DNA helicase